jgi:hypothetical protein
MRCASAGRADAAVSAGVRRRVLKRGPINEMAGNQGAFGDPALRCGRSILRRVACAGKSLREFTLRPVDTPVNDP